MIIRVFRAVVHEGKQEEFERFFRSTAIPLLEAQRGMLGLSVGRPMSPSTNEFVMVTHWESHDALVGFTGENWNQAVIDSREAHLLKETHVHHYESMVPPGPVAGS